MRGIAVAAQRIRLPILSDYPPWYVTLYLWPNLWLKNSNNRRRATTGAAAMKVPWNEAWEGGATKAGIPSAGEGAEGLKSFIFNMP